MEKENMFNFCTFLYGWKNSPTAMREFSGLDRKTFERFYGKEKFEFILFMSMKKKGYDINIKNVFRLIESAITEGKRRCVNKINLVKEQASWWKYREDLSRVCPETRYEGQYSI